MFLTVLPTGNTEITVAFTLGNVTNISLGSALLDLVFFF
jgi:hypothetical protein